MTKRTVKNLSNQVLSEESFTYDAAGNITDAPGSCFAYDTNNRLVTFNGNAVSYDLDGNMLSNGSLCCTYDSANRLISAGGHTYTYNAEDVRIRNLCSNADTKYTYDTSSKLSKLLCKTTNGITTKYVYGRGLIGEEKCGEFKTYHFDCRGSTIAITDICGNITDTFAYDTYGKCIAHIGNSFVIFGYNGRDGVITDKNGLIYMRARYYSPDMKRFINADIIPGEISNAITLNRFAYANGNPVSFIDPFGLRSMYFATHAITKDGDESNIIAAKPTKTTKTNTTSSSTEAEISTSYGYSDDEYWDKLLGENDAIYVADYDCVKSNGLPVVAHAYVFIKDSEGKWIKTSFGGSSKADAKISYHSISPESIISALQSPLESVARESKEIYIGLGSSLIPEVTTTSYTYYIHIGGVQFVPIKGDFSASIDMASNESGGNYGGYHLIVNNCLHYARDVLRAGKADSADIESIIENSICIVPDGFYDQLYEASK